MVEWEERNKSRIEKRQERRRRKRKRCERTGVVKEGDEEEGVTECEDGKETREEERKKGR